MARPSRDDMQRALRDALGDGGENLTWEELVQQTRALRAHNESQIVLSQEVAISHAQHAQQLQRMRDELEAARAADIAARTDLATAQAERDAARHELSSLLRTLLAAQVLPFTQVPAPAAQAPEPNVTEPDVVTHERAIPDVIITQ